MKKTLILAFILAAASAVLGQPQAYTREKEWEKEIGAFLEIDQKQTPPAKPIVFTGSSTIRMWSSLTTDFPGMNVMNRGFGGSRLEDLNFFAPKIVLPYHPKKIVIYSGENDIEAKASPETVLARFREFIEFRDKNLPGTPIIYLSMKPSILRWQLWPEMQKANELIKAEASRHKKVNFVDIASKLIGPDGGKPAPDIFQPDGLHLNPKGYAILRAAVLPYLR